MKADTLRRIRVSVEGTVQGVGFRPFAHRLAEQLGLGGWVTNTSAGALLEVEGPTASVDQFLQLLTMEAPAAARIENVITQLLPTEGQISFSVQVNGGSGKKRSVVAPDMATCSDCLRELRDPHDRRFRYPFLTCTQCGPRFSIITSIPYDRVGTTMDRFPLCPSCLTEYGDEGNRRYHAESLACPTCGPQVALWNAQGIATTFQEEALLQACNVLRNEGILAMKGLGGFQLWVSAQSESAVQRLRERKKRPEKPFAVLFPSIEALKTQCMVSSQAETLLLSPHAPIVILPRRDDSILADAVAPKNTMVGAMLPYTPLHHLLMTELQFPVVATSGNRSEEPIVIDNDEALKRLNGIADVFLVHNRPIARPVDDSVTRVLGQEALVLRRARGYCPLPIYIKEEMFAERGLSPTLGMGGQVKNTVALGVGNQILLSQHIGDLSTPEAVHAFRLTIQNQELLLDCQPQMVACDLHPDYCSTLVAEELARSWNVPLIRVQHHHAHVASCMAEHGLTGEVLGVAWDGSGYGEDGMIWGGEFLKAGYSRFTRIAHLLPFRLPGGEQAVREPRRLAFSLLWECAGSQAKAFDLPHRRSLGSRHDQLLTLLQTGVASPLTTSMGRLFDAVASYTNLCQVGSFEGQAAMKLECVASRVYEDTLKESPYLIPLLEKDDGIWVADWKPMIRSLIEDVLSGVSQTVIAYRFHQALADLVGNVAEIVGLSCVVLTGGCFQNMLLTRLTKARLERGGFTVYTHQQVPPNDGGLALGQVMVAANRERKGDSI